MKEKLVFTFMIVSLLGLFLNFLELTKREQLENYDDDFYILKFNKIAFNFSKKYIDVASDNILLNKFSSENDYEIEENYDEKLDYIFFENAFILFCIVFCLAEFFIPNVLLFVIYFCNIFSDFSKIKFDSRNENYFPISHNGIVFLKFFIEIILTILTFLFLRTTYKKFNCFFCKNKNYNEEDDILF